MVGNKNTGTGTDLQQADDRTCFGLTLFPCFKSSLIPWPLPTCSTAGALLVKLCLFSELM